MLLKLLDNQYMAGIIDYKVNNSKIMDKIGEGTHGEVYECEGKYVLKKILNSSYDDGINLYGLREAAAIQALKNLSNVINAYDVDFKDEHICITMPLYNRNLNHPIYSIGGKINLTDIKRILFQIILGLHNANQMLITHRDVKPENILVDDNLNVVIADWGLSRFIQNDDSTCFTSEVQTLWYRCPELLLGQTKYNSGVDMWSIGCIFYELLTGNILFRSANYLSQIICIFNELGVPNENTWPGVTSLPEYKSNLYSVCNNRNTKINKLLVPDDCQDLLLQMLKMDPLSRINYVNALNHKYFSSLTISPIIHLPIKKISSEPIDITAFNDIQNDITPYRRTILIDWLNKVKQDYKFNDCTYGLAIRYMDLYLSKKFIKDGELKLLGIACISLASKINEIYLASLIEMLDLCGNCYTREQFLAMEMDVSKILRFDLYQFTEFTFLNLFNDMFCLSKHIYYMALEYIYFMMLDIDSRKYLPNEIAIGCICYCLSNYELIKDFTFIEKSRIIDFNIYINKLTKTYNIMFNKTGNILDIYAKFASKLPTI